MASVRAARATDADEVGRILAAGFHDDPVLTWVFSEPRRAMKLARFFEFLAHEALVPLGATYLLADSCAAWTPPDSPPWPLERGKRFTATLSEVCTPEDLERLSALDTATSAEHPATRLWYLGSLAAVPEARGRGLGAALLEHSIRVVDAAGLPAYLESTNPRNVSLYERHGFTATGVIVLPDGPSLTTMWRDARPT